MHTPDIATYEPPSIRMVMHNYARLLLIGFALMPACFVGYLYKLKFENHRFHEIAIGVATLEGLPSKRTSAVEVPRSAEQSDNRKAVRWLKRLTDVKLLP